VDKFVPSIRQSEVGSLDEAKINYPLDSFVSIYYLGNKRESFGMVVGHRKCRIRLTLKKFDGEYEEREDVQVQILTCDGSVYCTASSQILDKINWEDVPENVLNLIEVMHRLKEVK